MDARAWDERYAAERGMWGPPNPTVTDVVDAMPPGRAVDLGCGDGRHASWLAARGWQVEAVDFSRVAIEQARARPDTEHDRIGWVVADVSTWAPSRPPVDLVLVAYLQLPGLGATLERATTWLGSAGTLVYLGHARENIRYGTGGPQDPGVLPTIEQLAVSVCGVQVHRLEHVERDTGDGTAIDVLTVASPWA